MVVLYWKKYYSCCSKVKKTANMNGCNSNRAVSNPGEKLWSCCILAMPHTQNLIIIYDKTAARHKTILIQTTSPFGLGSLWLIPCNLFLKWKMLSCCFLLMWFMVCFCWGSRFILEKSKPSTTLILQVDLGVHCSKKTVFVGVLTKFWPSDRC